VFHRLAVANDDWGSPLSFGASVASLLYARDEGFYYRTLGAELVGTRESAPLGGAMVTWRLFAERQRTAGREPNTQFSVGNLVANARFIDNIEAQKAMLGGAGLSIQRGFGTDPTGFRLATVTNAEAAAGDFDYVRGSLEATLSRGLGPVAAAITGAAGTSGGGLPLQRAFYVGGLQTVRGQYASPTAPGQVGNAYWLTRAELGTNAVAFRPSIFYDMGWAGSRTQFSTPGRPLSGAGIGASFLDGLMRLDLSKGIYPEKKVRFDMYLEARF
jgi:hemolysin activation/secretion protein